MQKATKLHEGGIYAIGNAPTALLELIRLIKEGLAKPDLIIGMPVGFVSAAESKEELLKLEGIPYITNVGRKGGSTVTVAALNAISILADEQAKKIMERKPKKRIPRTCVTVIQREPVQLLLQRLHY